MFYIRRLHNPNRRGHGIILRLILFTKIIICTYITYNTTMLFISNPEKQIDVIQEMQLFVAASPEEFEVFPLSIDKVL